MRDLDHPSSSASPLLSPSAVLPDAGGGGGGGGGGEDADDPSWIFGCHGVFYNLALVLPSLMFVVFLAWKARKSLTRLSYGRSYIMIAYYALLWVVSILNLAWCFLQVWQCTPGKEASWNLLSLSTTSGMLFLEVSLVAFLLQGNQASGLDSLSHTFLVSGIAVVVDILLKAIYVFGLGVPLFLESTHRVKWGLWIVHKLLLAAVYALLVYMYNSKWREKLPARPAFYNYVIAMLCLYGVMLFACGLAGNGAAFGIWLYHLTVVVYHSFYPPFLYIIFLADFFQEEDLYLENIYYSEMKDAGFFDGDWE